MKILNILLIISAFLAAFYAYLFQSLDNYVDNRKNILREFLHNHIDAEPNLLILIQNIGKDQKVTYYFKELIVICKMKMSHPRFAFNDKKLQKRNI